MKEKLMKNQELEGVEQMNQSKINEKKLNKRKIKRLSEQGVTLVALVVTIIIMLILAGVALNVTLGDNGLFKMSKRAVEEYEKAEQAEKAGLDNLEKELDKITINPNDYIGAFVTGYEPDEENCTISVLTSGVQSTEYNKNGIKENGDQEFTTEKDMQWRIWDYDGTTLTIISSKPTTAKLYLSGAAGYNNGVYAVNEISRKCYTQQGLKDITVRNLRRTDIQKVSTYDYTNYKRKIDDYAETDETTGDIVYFGESRSYTDNCKLPIMWKEFDAKWDYEYSKGAKTGTDKECEIWEEENGYIQENGIDNGETTTELKDSYYWHKYSESEFKNSQYYDMLYKDEKDKFFSEYFWLAGRCARHYKEGCYFMLHRAGSGIVGGDILYRSIDDRVDTPSATLRPLVSIDLQSNNLELIENKEGEKKSYQLTTIK